MEPFGRTLPVYVILPFALLLACIAILPLVAPHFWESNRNKGIVVGLLAIPTAVYVAALSMQALVHSALEYVSFLALLGSLYVIAGGIHVSGDLKASPRNNTLILAAGAVLANLVGTTGASMLMIRVLLTTNSERKQVAHVPFFFILIVSNCAGLLTPLGDPPLFLGYLRGVPFSWTFTLLPFWLAAVSYLLVVFYYIDRRAYRAEQPRDIVLDAVHVQPVRVQGAAQGALLLLVIAAIFLPTPLRELAMASAALVSVFGLPLSARELNKFSYGPIIEVAVLFAGIFVTMVPALALLETRGAALGLETPAQFFWATGILSSVLDNAPTYLTFLSTAQGMARGMPFAVSSAGAGAGADGGMVVGVPHVYLAAISVGAVFMGANTYIGNGPNFMVRAIADEAGYHMPTFFGYAWRAVLVLAPVYVMVLFLLNTLY
jgi:Na+/H+ antiporter NhaD/arsenite permease-like protein